MIEVTLAAAMQLRTMLRTAGVVGVPGVRIRSEVSDAGFQILIEDRAQPGDAVSEARGIRFYVDDSTATEIGSVTLDLEGQDFVLRQVPAGTV